MSDDLRLGFHRLGAWLEDPVGLGTALAFAWAVGIWMFALAAALDFLTTIGLIVLGIVVVVALRAPISALARRWRRDRLELERRHRPNVS